MFKDAKQLASEAMRSRLLDMPESEVQEELLERILAIAWLHQSDPEPRKKVREEIKEQIERSATLQVRKGDSLEN
jgi:hypothetical protein